MNTITLEKIKERHNEITAMIAEFEKHPPSFEYQGKQIALNPGEIYVGTIVTPGEYGSYHLILLPGEAEEIDWSDAIKWAEKQGGEIPNRVESALLFATLKPEFQEECYWTRETHASDSSSAWCQGFTYGHQFYDRKDGDCRARAVRRLIIQ